MSSPQPRVRSYALDNLRTYLTVLVILHHAALAYGGTGSFGYRSPYHPPGSSVALTAFNVLNQTYFMGMFFLLSGYFSSIAAKKRSQLVLMKEKFKRLGVPTLIYSLFGLGIIKATVAWRARNADWHGVFQEFWVGVKSTRGAGGPTWYTATLLTFDAIYTVTRPSHFSQPIKLPADEHSLPSSTKSSGPHTEPDSPTPRELKTHHVILALTLTSLSSFAIRIIWPNNYIFTPLNLNIGYAPQYVLYYTTGIYIQRSGIPLSRIGPARTVAIVGLVVAALNVVGFFSVHHLLENGGSFRDIDRLAVAGANVFSLLYALLNEFVGFMFASLFLRLFYTPAFSKRWAVPRFEIDVAAGSYAAFLVHIPVLVGIMTCLDEERWRDVNEVVVAGLVGTVGVLASWVLGLGIKRGVDGWVGTGYL